MDLNEVLKMPSGFTPPDVTVTIDRIYDYKSGQTDKGPWSFQNIQVAGGGRLKLKGLPPFPEHHKGKTVTIRANQSKQHGLTGLKVEHEEYQGKTYDQLLITPSAKWEFAGSNGNGTQPVAAAKPPQPVGQPVSDTAYQDHILSCAELASVVSGKLDIQEAAAVQACFATVVIDCKSRNILLPPPKTIVTPSQTDEPDMGPPPDYTDEQNPFDGDPKDWPF